MNNPKWKQPNALKHGVFAQSPIIPGEDPEEFKELHSAVIAEWSPAGATEEEAVFTIATAMWRKRRADTFLRMQLLKNLFDISHPAFDESLSMLAFAGRMRRTPETAQEYSSRFLSAKKINYLNEKFPRSEFDSTAEWAQAVIDEIDLLVEPTPNYREYEVPEGLRGLLGERPEGIKKMLALRPSVHSGDLFSQELALNERLDAMIDRAIKRLIQLKAMKQMLRQASLERADDQPRKFATVANGPGKIVAHPRR
jgi:hypothetical protein